MAAHERPESIIVSFDFTTAGSSQRIIPITNGRVVHYHPDLVDPVFWVRDSKGKLRKLRVSQVVPETLKRGLSPFQRDLSKFAGRKTSELARAAGIRYLKHATPIRNVMQILDSGRLKLSGGLHSEEGVYFEAQGLVSGIKGKLPKLTRQPNFSKTANLQFNVSILDRQDFFGQPGTFRGVPMGRAVYAKDRAKLAGLLHDLSEGIVGPTNEFVFYGDDVSTVHLLGVEVHSEVEKAELLQNLKSTNISPPPGKRWEDIIVTRE